ncbi:hypothetical protein GCM10010520_23020 [Rhizobium viscosum]|uniref:HNH endonuclease 5 domain-containing protein n=1 Tax=Rhizobium viscosum TaxID=1673 RepID=A0ABR9IIS9_RHIVS|nr:HNH endonuclease [Rhizobium viscosum]MBE1503076.1 hypothetical protein [Rhizobium viscosum]
MRTCLYCDAQKSEESFSDEHIWPNALGGDFLPRDVWRTDDVCQSCNSLAGVFVDGAFIRSWVGQAELSNGSLEYLAGKGKVTAIPLDYLGPIQDVPLPEGHVADYWAGPCGANIVHIRPDDGDEEWVTYAGGDPRRKRSKAGRAYVALTSTEEFWILVSLESFRQHFRRAERFVVNAELPPNWPFRNLDRADPIQAGDMQTVDAVLNASRDGSRIRTRPAISFDLGNRMLAKLGLGVGYKLLGEAFLRSDYAKTLRWGMREANTEKRRLIPVRGSPLFGGAGLGGAEEILKWPGGWVLMVMIVEGSLGLFIISPSGRSMNVLVCNDQDLIDTLDPNYVDGVVWITVPAAAEAIGPISLPAYLAHQMNTVPSPSLVALAAKRGDRANIPSCRPTGPS